jgi:hypothetical protein
MVSATLLYGGQCSTQIRTLMIDQMTVARNRRNCIIFLHEANLTLQKQRIKSIVIMKKHKVF